MVQRVVCVLFRCWSLVIIKNKYTIKTGDFLMPMRKKSNQFLLEDGLCSGFIKMHL
jgi:hypothetical protein